tara:strand:+ start:695 stop:1543 length:849 start_codon:yes stop_codon:yes gene_type:complete
MRILVLGASGMLGNAFYELFKKNRSKEYKFFFTLRKKNKNFLEFDPNKIKTYKIIKKINPNIIINCIGVIKPHIDENSPSSIINAFEINSMLPRKLLKNFPKSKIIHFNTDCVFSGKTGNYTENHKKDCNDIYGISKSLGEVSSSRIMNLRCSIIGIEKKTKLSLLSWFLSNQTLNINGFTNHYWNGLTTSSLARIVHGIIKNKNFKHGLFNIVPKDTVTKYALLKMFNKKFFRNKKNIIPVKNLLKINRILLTDNINFNKNLWKNAGYSNIPTIKDMIEEL